MAESRQRKAFEAYRQRMIEQAEQEGRERFEDAQAERVRTFNRGKRIKKFRDWESQDKTLLVAIILAALGGFFAAVNLIVALVTMGLMK
jgi:hypothetical protein